jgi:hypothetical protein
MPIRQASSMMQACRMQPWPTVTSSPISVGKPPLLYGLWWLTWMIVPSWMLLRAPMRTKLTSPRITVPGQTDASSPSSTSPMMVQAGSM